MLRKRLLIDDRAHDAVLYWLQAEGLNSLPAQATDADEAARGR
jgi:hypothetical protein